jgi:hypothetical protein
VTEERPVCIICGRATEICAFCDDPACQKVTCYSCLIVELGEAIPVLHPHGG